MKKIPLWSCICAGWLLVGCTENAAKTIPKNDSLQVNDASTAAAAQPVNQPKLDTARYDQLGKVAGEEFPLSLARRHPAF